MLKMLKMSEMKTLGPLDVKCELPSLQQRGPKRQKCAELSFSIALYIYSTGKGLNRTHPRRDAEAEVGYGGSHWGNAYETIFECDGANTNERSSSSI
jgi:hypothetical protein